MNTKESTFRANKYLEGKINHELLYENSGTLNCFFDHTGKLILYNKKFTEIFGNQIPFLKTHKGQNKYPYYFNQLIARLNKGIQTGKTFTYSTNYQVDGHDVWFEGNYIPIHNENEKILGIQIISRDITKQKQFEQKLSEKEFYLNKAQQLAHFGSWKWDLKSGEVIWSVETYRIFDVIPGTKMFFEEIVKYFDPKDIEKINSDLEEVIKNKQSYTFETKITTFKNKLKYVYTIAEPIFNPQGIVTHIFGTVQDITERIEAQKIIVNSENRYRKLFDMLSDPTFLIDRESGRILELNNAALDCYKYSRDEALEMRNIDFSAEPKETRKALVEKADKVLLRWHRKKSGEIFPVEIKATNFNWKGSDVHIAVCRDISDRVNKEKSLRDFERIFNLTVNLMVIADLKGNIIKVNPAVKKILGYSKEEFEGNNIRNFIYKEDLNKTFEFLEEKLKVNANVINLENRYVCKNGNLVWFSWNAQIVYDESISFSVAHDITKLKNIENELINAKNKAEESDRLKTSFLCNMSHEIRTPMNGIIGFSDILVQKDISEEKRDHYAKIINRSCNRLLNIINDIIDVSKIETGQIEIKNSNINIKQFFDEINNFYLSMQKEDVIFLVESKPEQNDHILLTDPIKLRQILDNLIINAFKFTEKGAIKAGYEIKKNNILFFVQDTGCGISKKHKDSIFERFMQVEENHIRKQNGTGLGLSICKAYVNKMGGKIWYESKIGKGSTFYFTLPSNK